MAVRDRHIIGQFSRYGFAGATAVAVHLAILTALVELMATPPVLASAFGFLCATLVNYALQHRFVFGRARGHSAYLLRYLSVTASTMILNTILFWLFREMGLVYLAAQMMTIAIIVPINFICNRNFTFAT